MHQNYDKTEMRCGFCPMNLAFLTLSEREAHYENPLLERAKLASTPALASIEDVLAGPIGLSISPSGSRDIPNVPLAAGKAPKSRSKGMLIKENDVFWCTGHDVSPPTSFTPGLIHILRKGLAQGHTRGLIRRAVLCHETTVHVNRELWDAGWGCGYRNFLIACSALMCQIQQPSYSLFLNDPLPPSIRNLQLWIESAWQAGFDPEGRRQLGSLADTRKWIGTSDLWVAFTSRGIPAELVDFHLSDQLQGREIVMDWIVRYFSPSNESNSQHKNAFEAIQQSSVTVTDKMPIILQHAGHSRTVIGYEIDRNGKTCLLTFDPSHKPTLETRTMALDEFMQVTKHVGLQTGAACALAGPSGHKRKRPIESLLKGRSEGRPFSNSKQSSDFYSLTRRFRLDVRNLSKKKEYQILYFPMSAPLTEDEKRNRHKLRSTRIT